MGYVQGCISFYTVFVGLYTGVQSYRHIYSKGLLCTVKKAHHSPYLVRVQGLTGFKSLGFTGLGSDLSSKIYGFRRSGSRVGASRFVELGD